MLDALALLHLVALALVHLVAVPTLARVRIYFPHKLCIECGPDGALESRRDLLPLRSLERYGRQLTSRVLHHRLQPRRCPRQRTR